MSTLFPNDKALNNALLSIDIKTDSRDSHSTWFHPAPLADASLPNPGLEIKEQRDGPGGQEVTFVVTAPKAVAANVWIDYPATVRGFFDINGFWLDKGESKVVKFTVWEDTTRNRDWVEHVTVKSLYDNTQKSSKPFL